MHPSRAASRKELFSQPNGSRQTQVLDCAWGIGERDVQGAIVADDEPRAPGRTAVRVMHDLCAWLLDVGLPAVARRAFTVAEESDRLAIKKAKVTLLRISIPLGLKSFAARSPTERPL